MVLALSDSLINFSPVDRQEFLDCMTNILIGYYESNYYLEASFLFCDRIEKELTDRRAIVAIRHLKKSAAFRLDVLWRYTIVHGIPDASKKEISYLFFSKTDSIQRPFLLGEDLYDVEFYKKLSARFHPDAPIKCFEVHGGGSSTGRMLNIIRRKKCFCLTIVDSDKCCEKDEIKKNAQECKRFENNFVPISVNVLSVREIENLIPIRQMYRSCNSKAKSFLKRIERKNAYSFLDYYDIKCGIKKKDINDNKLYYEFVNQMYDKIRNKRDKSFAAYLKSLDDDEYVFQPISKQLIKDFIEGGSSICQDRNEPLRKELGDLVYTMCVTRSNDIISID